MGWPGSVTLTRRTATVTISAPEATMASRVSAKSLYLPVPTIRRERKRRPATSKVSSSRTVAASSGTPPPMKWTISSLSPSPRETRRYWDLGTISRLRSTATLRESTPISPRSFSTVSGQSKVRSSPLMVKRIEGIRPHRDHRSAVLSRTSGNTPQVWGPRTALSTRYHTGKCVLHKTARML